MPKLTTMQGLPASGKSKRAEEIQTYSGNTLILNRDLLRLMLHNNKWSHINEKITIECQMLLARHLLKEKNVIIDDCNMSDKHVSRWKGVAQEMGVKFELISLDTDWKECVERDKNREKKVGQGVITSMAFQYKKIPEIGEDIIVCDLDGTIADCSHRVKKYLNQETGVPGQVHNNWLGFFSEIAGDTFIFDTWNQVAEMAAVEKAHVIYVTARPESCRQDTMDWLSEQGIYPTVLLMRSNGDRRPDDQVKESIYNSYLKQYNVVAVFDDRPAVIRMWEKNGLKVINCGFGKEF